MTGDSSNRRKIGFSPFGRHTRYMLSGYLRHVLIVTMVLLAIALTIDLWPQFQIIATARGPGGLNAAWSVLRFSALRTPGLVAPFLPFATFLGVVWTEVVHTRTGERMLVWNSGRSPLQCLAPALLLGLILGTAEFAMDGFLGPASMAVQMHERLGLDGARLDRTKLRQMSWMAVSGELVRAEIEYGPPPVLHNLTVFKRDANGHLVEVDLAASARPDNGLWRMENGQTWKSTGRAGGNEAMVPFITKTIPLGINPLWLSVYGMEPQYIPLGTLVPLTRINPGTDVKGSYRTRLQVVCGDAFLPGAMAILAASLAMLFLAYGTSTAALVGIVFAGYVAHFGTKACLMLGQNGFMAPVLAGWLVPTGLLLATAIVLAVSVRQRKPRATRA